MRKVEEEWLKKVRTQEKGRRREAEESKDI